MSLVMLVVVVVATLVKGGAAQSGCTVALMSLSPCLNYVSGNSSSPSASCCTSLSSVVGSQPQCLCTLLRGGGSSLGITVNQTLALALPGVCKVQTPPLSRCDDANAAPAPADAGAPSGSADEAPDSPTPTTPAVTDIPSGAGSKTVPRTDGSTTNSGSNVGPKMGVVVLMASLWAIS
ncbi:non-specific lipid transfer protein GPI-anchored 5-like isoform X2 [Salvia miltiorrhiza]|uniref:non-specific lipid transfer protein GPI-anchored 5-like isoform X2 n=1 Tax=Salvia miltiorrhiza TaxID=226208 RepID=UPI0025ABDEDA|nr:non-specific lipid transfer protein GPI-anchored 5-like isoform X2 [Salvia miltiorrhiza]